MNERYASALIKMLDDAAYELNTLNFYHLDQCDQAPETLITVARKIDSLRLSLRRFIQRETEDWIERAGTG